VNRRIIATSIAGIAAAASVGTAVALPSKAMSHSGTFTFIAVTTTAHTFGNNHFVGGDKDVRAGHIIGTDSFRCVPVSKTTGNCEVAASYNFGQLYATFTEHFKTGALAGKVTGGTGKFANATGTVTGSAVSQTKEKVTVSWQTP
jgi:hypothetical protein